MSPDLIIGLLSLAMSLAVGAVGYSFKLSNSVVEVRTRLDERTAFFKSQFDERALFVNTRIESKEQALREIDSTTRNHAERLAGHDAVIQEMRSLVRALEKVPAAIAEMAVLVHSDTTRIASLEESARNR